MNINTDKWQIAWTKDNKDRYGTNCDCIIEEEVIVATFDSKEDAQQYLEACKTQAYRDNPNLYLGYRDKRSYFLNKSPLAYANRTARVEKCDDSPPPPHNPPIDWL